MELYGFNQNCIEFFKNYLKNRTQKTLINNKFSDPLTVTHGLPQGSNVGPLMFLLYINDLGFSIRKGNYKLFADDTTLYCSDHKIENCIKNLNEDLDAVNKWCLGNNMLMNTKKTKIMIFGKKK